MGNIKAIHPAVVSDVNVNLVVVLERFILWEHAYLDKIEWQHIQWILRYSGLLHLVLPK